MKRLLIPILLIPQLCFCQAFNSIQAPMQVYSVRLLSDEAQPLAITKNPGDGPPDRSRDDGKAALPLNIAPDFSLPLMELRLTSGFGYRTHPITGRKSFHAGVDLRAKSDTVRAILDGVVTRSGYDPLLGYSVRICHGDYESVYGHLSRYFVLLGDSVFAGTGIGISGNSGRTTGEHLHFGVRLKGRPVNPLAFLIHLSKTKNPKLWKHPIKY